MSKKKLTDKKLTLYYDGACPLCRKEVRWLQARCRRKDLSLAFVDISQDGFDPGPTGKQTKQLMAELHLQDNEGNWWTAMDASRRIYQEIGLGWLMAPTGWPFLKPVFDRLYHSFAKIRPRLQKKDCPQCTR
ncbi:thiol-disulfide oxidoreductase DCC family protein [Oceanospirillum sp.]|uniref:thiol-disulfide oxidoreductase DCC family protein n=1 Tax=Oceanospirillum sp. TaxID=2021254 RepID=UPI003A8E6893